MVGSFGYFHFNIIYSQLAAIDNVVLGGHDEKHVSQCRLRTLWFAGIAEQFELLNLWPLGGRSRPSVCVYFGMRAVDTYFRAPNAVSQSPWQPMLSLERKSLSQ